MRRTNLLLAALFTVAVPGAAQAQFPNMDMSGIMAQNLTFDRAMMQQAANFAQQWYEQRQAYRRATGDWGYLPGPVSAMDLSRTNTELSAAYDAYNRSWARNSNSALTASGNYGYAIRGTWNYGDGSGTVYELPYSANQWWLDGSGTAYGTRTSTPPDYWNQYTPLTPIQ